MEVKCTRLRINVWVRFCLCTFLFCATTTIKVSGQPPTHYTVKNGKMFITLSKQLRATALDSFIDKYSLTDLALKYFIKTNSPNSLHKQGWNIEENNNTSFTISKPLLASGNLSKAAEKYVITAYSERAGATGKGIVYGYNKFRNKHPFDVRDSIVTFFLRNNLRSTRVMLAGSFNDWAPDAVAMTKTDSGWIARVKLGQGKYWYKFVADGNWMIDNDNLLKENDSKGNTNSVFYKTNTLFALHSFADAKQVFLAGSFNNWRPTDLSMNRTASGWQLPLYLAKGTHTYKYVVDGKWYGADVGQERLPDGFGSYNFAVRLGQPHLFKLNGYENAKQVRLVGSFNNWREFELEMSKTEDGWQLSYVIGPGNYEYKYIVDGKWITDPGNTLTTGNTNKGNSFLVIAPNYTFRLKGFGNAKKVFLSGDLNSWNANSLPMKQQGDNWVFQVHLSPGKHRYKFVVDDKWILDPNNKLWEQNEYHTGNSIVWIE